MKKKIKKMSDDEFMRYFITKNKPVLFVRKGKK